MDHLLVADGEVPDGDVPPTSDVSNELQTLEPEPALLGSFEAPLLALEQVVDRDVEEVEAKEEEVVAGGGSFFIM